MPDVLSAPKRKIFITLFEHAIERTEEEIKELKDCGLFRAEAPPDAPLAPHLQTLPEALAKAAPPQASPPVPASIPADRPKA